MTELVVALKTNSTITTLELRDLVNSARGQSGEAEVSNAHFIARVLDELSDFQGVNNLYLEKLPSGQTAQCLRITIEQATLVGMRESKSVRRAVLDVLKEMAEPVAPQTYIGALKALVAAEEAKEAAILIASKALATKAEIGHRREATAMNTASQAVKTVNKLQIELDNSKEWASIKRMEMLHPTMKFDWRKLKSASNALEVDIQSVVDANYGKVNSYHASAWLAAYGVELPE